MTPDYVFNLYGCMLSVIDQPYLTNEAKVETLKRLVAEFHKSTVPEPSTN